MKYMREHRRPGKSKAPDVWKILSLLYEPGVEEHGKLRLKRSSASISKVMRLSKCSRWTVNRVLKACEEGGKEAVLALNWTTGPPATPAPPEEEIDWLVDPATLRQQAHMSLEQRAGAFNRLFDRELRPHHIRALYRYGRVSKQRFRGALGPPSATEKAMAKQERYLLAAKEKFADLERRG